MNPALLFVALATATAQASTPSDEFERGKNAYDRGEYARAIEILRPLLYPEIRLESEGAVVQGHRMLGVAHLFEKQDQLAALEFQKLLQLRPDYRMDPLLDSPYVVEFFNGVLRDYESELSQLDSKRKEAEREQQRQRDAVERARVGPTIEKRFGRNSFGINFIPFGAGQFQNGQRGKGWAFLVSESLLGAASVGTMAANFALYGIRPKRTCKLTSADATGGPCPAGQVIDRSAEDRSRLLLQVQLVSGGLFFATAAWGIADAIVNYRPEVPLAGGEAHRRFATCQPRLQVAPIFAGSTLGAGVSFRF